jgi:hypothetical protein
LRRVAAEIASASDGLL